MDTTVFHLRSIQVMAILQVREEPVFTSGIRHLWSEPIVMNSYSRIETEARFLHSRVSSQLQKVIQKTKVSLGLVKPIIWSLTIGLNTWLLVKICVGKIPMYIPIIEIGFLSWRPMAEISSDYGMRIGVWVLNGPPAITSRDY